MELYDDSTGHLVEEAKPYTPSATLRKLNHPLMIMADEERVVSSLHTQKVIASLLIAVE